MSQVVTASESPTQRRLAEVLGRGPVMPVVVLESVDHAVPLARALLAGGISAIELTLRTGVAWTAMCAIRDQVPEMAIGVGTVTRVEDLERAAAEGAAFAVSPGTTPKLVEAAARLDVPYLPGVATASEAMRAYESGLGFLKLFPAQQVGGAELLRAWSGPLPHLWFCPTGGIRPDTAKAYLSLPNVVCVGGTWLAPKDLLDRGAWSEITDLARQAASLRCDA